MLNTPKSRASFNSSIGILSVRTHAHPRRHRRGPQVSIPRSEFFRFGHGIDVPLTLFKMEFQFLDRNSFGSDDALPDLSAQFRVVSIPRSEFFRFGQTITLIDNTISISFNSSIGILSVRTKLYDNPNRHKAHGFNSSIGILSVRTRPALRAPPSNGGVSIPRSEFFRFGPRHA